MTDGLEVLRCEGEGYHRVVDGPKWTVAALNYAERFDEKNITYLERHNLTDETFVLLGPKGAWTAEIFRDADDAEADPRRYVHETRAVRVGDALAFPLAPGGGLVVRFTRTERAGSPALAVNGDVLISQRRRRVVSSARRGRTRLSRFPYSLYNTNALKSWPCCVIRLSCDIQWEMHRRLVRRIARRCAKQAKILMQNLLSWVGKYGILKARVRNVHSDDWKFKHDRISKDRMPETTGGRGDGCFRRGVGVRCSCAHGCRATGIGENERGDPLSRMALRRRREGRLPRQFDYVARSGAGLGMDKSLWHGRQRT